MNFLGEEGYLALTDTVMKTAIKLREGIAAIPGLEGVEQPGHERSRHRFRSLQHL